MANIPFLNNAYFAAKVGIGTESTTVGLQLGNSTLGQTKLAIFNSEGGGEVGLTIKSRTNRAKLRVSDNDSNAYVVAEAGKSFFGTSPNGDTTNITVLTSGKVGIGTINPTEKLVVQDGKVLAGHTNARGYGFHDLSNYTYTANTGRLSLVSNGAEAVSIDSSQNVGIGATTPEKKLHIKATTSDATPQVLVQNASTGDASILLNVSGQSYVFGIDYDDSKKFKIASSGNLGTTDRITLLSTGNVGIGTITPEEKLNVIGSVLISNNEFYKVENTTGQNFKIAGLTNGNVIQIGAIDYTSAGTIFAGGDNVSITTGGASGSTRIKIASSGNVGIGTTSPDLKLDVSHATGGQYVATFQNTAANLELKLGVTSTNYLNIQGQQINNSAAFNMSLQADGGNVGIGTTTPTAKLHVAGTGLFTGLVSGITPVAAANFVTKAYVDGSGGGTGGPFLPLTAGSTKPLTGDLHINSGKQLRLYRSDNATYARFDYSAGSVGLDIDDLNGDGINLQQAGVNKLRIETSGNATFAGDITLGDDLNFTTNGFADISNTGTGAMRFKPSGQTLALTLTGANATFAGIVETNKIFVAKGQNLAHTPSSIKISQESTAKSQIRFYGADTSTAGILEFVGSTSNGSASGARLTINADGSSTFAGDVNLLDNKKLKIGTGGDFEIQHNGSNTLITNNIGNVVFTQNANDKNIVFNNDNGSGGITEYFKIDGLNENIKFSVPTVHIDNKKALFGTSGDLEIFHSGTASVINNKTGGLFIKSTQTDGNIVFEADNGSGGVATYFFLDGGSADGTNLYTKFPDSSRLLFGTGEDLQIYHDGSNSRINETGTGDLIITGGNDILFNDPNGFVYMNMNQSNSVELYYANSKKLETGIVSVGTATTAGGTLIDGWITTTQANAINNTTIATTAYVNNKIALIPAGLVFQGTWDARTAAEGGAAGNKGNPALTSGVGTTGNFYIVSNAGSVNLDGITDWKVGDWAVFIEQGASDQWEKIDNSSVLDGFGAGQSVTKWDGSGTSNTLTNGPITFSGNNSTFAGMATFNTDVVKISTDGTYGGSYGTVGFGGISNGSNRVFGHTGTGDGLFLASATGKGIFFRVSGGAVDNMAITPEANVGIATINPYAFDTTATRLHVKNAGSSGSVSEVARFEGSSDASGSGGTIRLTTSNDRGMYFEGGRTSTVPYGKIGLTEYNGAKTPIMTLFHDGATSFVGNVSLGGSTTSYLESRYNTSSQFSSRLAFNGLQLGNNGENRIIAGRTSAGSPLAFYVNNTNDGLQNTPDGILAMKIIANGNVGIGTTTPNNKLTIASGSGGGTPPDSRTQLYVDKNGEAYISINSPAGSFNGLRLNAAGVVKGFFELYDNTSQGKKLSIGTVDARDVVFNTTNTEKMRITAAGNVGIGVTGPTAKLHVSGNTKLLGGIFSVSTDAAEGSSGFSYKFRDAVGINNPNSVSAPAVSGYVMSVGRSTSGSVGGGIYVEGESRFVRGLAGGIKFNAYDGTNQVGTPTYILGTDATGNVVKVLGSSVPGSVSGSGTLNKIPLWTPNSSTIGDSMISQVTTSNVLMKGAGNDFILSLDPDNNAIGDTSTVIFNDRARVGWFNSAVYLGDGGSNKDIKLQTNLGDIISLTSNTERMRIKFDTGNVGIGTTSPNGKLTILEANATNKGDFDFQQIVYNGSWSNNVDGLAAIQWSDGVGSSNTIGRIGVTYTGSQGEFQIKDLFNGGYAGSGKVFTVRGDGQAYFSGKVGIGTTSPVSPLVVKGADVGATDNIAVQNSAGTKTFSVSNNGQVNINGSQKIVTSDASIELRNNATGLMSIKSASNYGITFGDNGGETMRINTSTNRVGIGTTSPGALLDLSQANGANIRFNNPTTSKFFTIGEGVGTNNVFSFRGNSYRSTDTMSIDFVNDRVGIGTISPVAKFEVTDGSSSITLQEYQNGATIFLDGVNGDFIGGDYYHIIANGSSYLGLGGYGGGSTPLNIDSVGKVGIGTTLPSARLNVVNTSSTSIPALQVASSASLANNDIIRFQINGLTNGFRMFQNASSVVNYTFQDGNVGIGTTSPRAEGLEIFRRAGVSGTPQFIISTGESSSRDYSFATDVMAAGDFAILDGATSTTANVRMRFVDGGTTIAFRDNNTTELGRYVSTATGGSIKRIRMCQGGEVHFGDTTTANPLGITEGNWNSFADNDFLSIFARNRLDIYTYPNGGTKTASIGKSDGTSFILGKVGIGTTSPSANLDVFSAASFRADVATGNPLISIVNNTAIVNTAGTATIKFTQANTQAGGKIVSGRDGNYSSGATRTSNLQFYTSTAASDTEKMRINSDGAIKFNAYNGTNNTGSPTHILGTDANGLVVKSTAGSSIGPWLPLAAGSGDPLTGDLYLKTTNDANIAREQIKWQTSQGTNRSFIRVGGSYADNALEFGTGNAILGMILHANGGLSIGTTVATALPPASGLLVQGNVGIGTTSPGRPLTINSDNADRAIRILENDSANESWDIGVDVDGDLNFFNSADTSPSVTFLDGGNVGIGTSNPLGELHINAPTGDVSLILSHTQNVQNAFIDFNGNSGGTQARIGYGDALGDIFISPNFSAGPAITLKNSNNVGIGLTNPGQKLEVAGNVKVNDGYIRSEDGATGDFIQIFNDGAVSGQSFITTSSLDLVLIPQNGKLQVKGENFGSGNNASLEIFNALNAAVKIKLNSNGDSFLNGGDVGIGTSSPAAKLDVAGVIFAADGNKALPGYSFASDPDTGMIRDSANVLTFVVGADRRMSISTTAVTSFLPLGVGVTGVTSGVQLQVQGNVLFGSSGVGDFYLGNYATSNHFRFHTNNSNTFFDMNCGDIYWRQGASTRYTFFPSTANMTVNGTITQLSDIRNKENIVEIGDCINKVQAMRGVYYNRTDINTEVTKVGVIAQEVENVLPELIIESPEDGLKSVAYSELTAVLINAIKEQQEIIEDLKTRITKLEN